MESLPAELHHHLSLFLDKENLLVGSTACRLFRCTWFSEAQLRWLKDRPDLRTLLVVIPPRLYPDFGRLFPRGRFRMLPPYQILESVYCSDSLRILRQHWSDGPYQTITDVVANDDWLVLSKILQILPRLSVIHVISRRYRAEGIWAVRCFLGYLGFISMKSYYYYVDLYRDSEFWGTNVGSELTQYTQAVNEALKKLADESDNNCKIVLDLLKLNSFLSPLQLDPLREQLDRHCVFISPVNRLRAAHVRVVYNVSDDLNVLNSKIRDITEGERELT